MYHTYSRISFILILSTFAFAALGLDYKIIFCN